MKNLNSILNSIWMSVLLYFFANSAIASQGEIKIALNWKAEPQFGGFYAAEKNGHFQKAKIKVKIMEGGSGTPTAQMLASKQVDFAIVSADEIILAHDRGARDLIAVFATFQTNPQGIMTRAERNFKTIDDVFKNTGTLLWQSGLPYAQFIKKKYKSLHVQTAPYVGGIGNFQNDPKISQQCFVTSEPLLAEKAGLKVKTFLIAETGYNPYTTVVAVRAERIKDKPEETKRMIEALRQGWWDYLKNPQPINHWMATLNKSMDVSTFEKSAQSQAPLIDTLETKKSGLGSMTSERWQTLADQLFELKLIQNKVLAKDLFQNL